MGSELEPLTLVTDPPQGLCRLESQRYNEAHSRPAPVLHGSPAARHRILWLRTPGRSGDGSCLLLGPVQLIPHRKVLRGRLWWVLTRVLAVWLEQE